MIYVLAASNNCKISVNNLLQYGQIFYSYNIAQHAYLSKCSELEQNKPNQQDNRNACISFMFHCCLSSHVLIFSDFHLSKCPEKLQGHGSSDEHD
jgi:hypothetical protein